MNHMNYKLKPLTSEHDSVKRFRMGANCSLINFCEGLHEAKEKGKSNTNISSFDIIVTVHRYRQSYQTVERQCLPLRDVWHSCEHLNQYTGVLETHLLCCRTDVRLVYFYFRNEFFDHVCTMRFLSYYKI